MLLTLDLSTRNVGYTCGEPSDEQFSSGAQPFSSTGEDIGAFGLLLHRWLSTALAGVTCCVFEAPILHASKASLPVLRKLYGAAYHVELLCAVRKIRCLEANNQDVKTFMGVSRTRGTDQKAEMVRCVKAYGYEPGSHDEADAIGIRLYVLHQMFPEAAKAFPLALGPLGLAAAIG